MNKYRRKMIERVQDEIRLLYDKIEDLRSEIDCIKEEEQEAYDNLPESLQYSDRGDAMQQSIDALETAYDYIDDCYSRLEEFDNSLEEAIGL